MSTNMELITSVTVGSGGAASVTLPATGTIPQTYTDLKLVYSARATVAGTQEFINISFNGNTSNYSLRSLQGDGSAASSNAWNFRWIGYAVGSTATASTFSNGELYIPNYTSSNFKSFSGDNVTENNITNAQSILTANLWSDTAAITTIALTVQGGSDFVEGSTFYLYGISNVTSTTKATGGIVSSDGTYNYHMFPFSGTFTPTQNITVDYLVIAGGGGGPSNDTNGAGPGGGGAGGLRSTVGATGGGGSLESALSLTANTGYTVTIGAGGAGGGAPAQTAGAQGGNSVFSTITSTGGGQGSVAADPAGAGGSGGGSYFNRGVGQRTASPVQGNNGGTSVTGGPASGGGGGGGAGAAGGAGTTAGAGNGGDGVQITAFAIATQTGANNGYYAGGGGGGNNNGNGTKALGGLGGGGNAGQTAGSNGLPGLTNTGGGGGSSQATGTSTVYTGGAGGSGLVIIRYAI